MQCGYLGAICVYIEVEINKSARIYIESAKRIQLRDGNANHIGG